MRSLYKTRSLASSCDITHGACNVKKGNTSRFGSDLLRDRLCNPDFSCRFLFNIFIYIFFFYFSWVASLANLQLNNMKHNFSWTACCKYLIIARNPTENEQEHKISRFTSIPYLASYPSLAWMFDFKTYLGEEEVGD